MTESRKVKTMKNAIVGMVMLVLSYVAIFVYRMLFLRVLTIEYFGAVNFVTSVIAVLSLSEMGVSTAITYFLYKPLADGNEDRIAAIVKFLKKIYLIIAVVTLVIGLVLIPFLPYFIKETVNVVPKIEVIYLFYLLSNILSYFIGSQSTLLMADQRNYVSNIITSGSKILTQVIAIILLIVTKRFVIVLVTENVFLLLQYLAFKIMVYKLYPFLRQNSSKLDKAEQKDVVKYTGSVFFSKLGAVVLTSTDGIIISTFLGLTISGFYSNYLILLTAISAIITLIFTSVTASLGNFIATKDKEQQIEIYKVFNFIAGFVSTIGALGMYFVSANILTLWLGQSYVLDKWVVLSLCVMFFVENMARSNGAFISTLGLVPKTVKVAWVYPVVNLVSSIVFVQFLGLSGIFLGTILARVIIFPYETWLVNKIGLGNNIKKNVALMLLNIAIAAASFGIIWLISLINIPNIILSTVVLILACVTVPSALYLLVYGKRKEVKMLISFLPLKNKKVQQ